MFCKLAQMFFGICLFQNFILLYKVGKKPVVNQIKPTKADVEKLMDRYPD